jgi:ATP-binding cassette, subfamily A (ABC1), member 3
LLYYLLVWLTTLVFFCYFFFFLVTTPVLLALGLLFSVASMISYLVQEKELRQKEMLKMMSVTEFDIEFSWFITFMLFNAVTSLLCTIVSSYLFPFSEPLMLLVFWLLTFLSLTLYSTALAACSSKATRGILVGLLFFFSGLFVSLLFPIRLTSPTVVSILMIHPVTVFSYAIDLLGALDDVKVGLTSESVSYVHYYNQCSFRQMFMGYLYSCVFWFALTWYLNRSIAPEYGQAAEVWYFPFTLSYWKSFYRRRTNGQIRGEENAALEGPVAEDVHINDDGTPAVEGVSESLRKQSTNGESIEILNLSRHFGDKAAVDGLNLSMYNGQITALLGHNGTFWINLCGFLHFRFVA